MFSFVIIPALIILVICLVAARGQKSAGITALGLIVLSGPVFIMACMGAPLFGVSLELVCVAVAIGLIRPFATRPSSYRWATLGGTLVALGIVFGNVWSYQKHIRELRERFVQESLDARLAYEPAAEKRPINVDKNALESLEEALQEGGSRGRVHEHTLEQLHQDYVDDFINTPGFGIGRGRMMRTEGLRLLPKDDPIPQAPPTADPLSAEDLFRESTPLTPEQRDLLLRSAPVPALQSLHRRSILSFLDPAFFGAGKDRSRVVGFIPHFFRERPTLEEGVAWKVESIELMSLLKHEEPVVYVSSNLPRMKELADVPTRPLTAFEKRGLQELEAGRDLHADHAPEFIRMVGSIRAVNHCLRCHHGERGRLLGAFTYRLVKQETE